MTHPLNAGQTPVTAGRIPDYGGDNQRWYVALAHLAHERGACSRCEAVWARNDNDWADIPEDDGHAAVFAAIWPPGSRDDNTMLLVHIDDVPQSWIEA